MGRDDTIVVFHGAGTDKSAGSLCNHIDMQSDLQPASECNIQDLTWAQVEKDCKFIQSPCFPCPEDSIRLGRIPKLEEVLQLAKESGLNLKIELKGANTVDSTLELVDQYNMMDQSAFSSFQPDHIARVSEIQRNLRKKSPTGLLFTGNVP